MKWWILVALTHRNLVAGGLILQDNGPDWKRARSFMDPSFSVVSIKSCQPIVQARVQDLLAWMESQLDQKVNGGPHTKGTDLQPAFHGLTFDIITMITLGFDPVSFTAVYSLNAHWTRHSDMSSHHTGLGEAWWSFCLCRSVGTILVLFNYSTNTLRLWIHVALERCEGLQSIFFMR